MISNRLIKALIIFTGLLTFTLFYAFTKRYIEGIIMGIITILMFNLTEMIRREDEGK